MEEKIFATLIMIMSSGIFAYIVGSIGSILGKKSQIENNYREIVVAVNSYMKKKSFSKSLKIRVRRYLDYISEQKITQINEKELLSMLSESLRDEFYAYINANIIKNCKVFEIYDSHLLTQITRVLESETYAPGDTIFKEGELSYKLYYITTGTVNIYHHETKTVY